MLKIKIGHLDTKTSFAALKDFLRSPGHKLIKSLLIFIAWCTIFNTWYLTSLAQDRILAVVNSEIITQRDLDDFLRFMQMQFAEKYQDAEVRDRLDSIKKDLLDRLIEDRLILHEAKKENIKVDQNWINSRMEQIKRRYRSDEEFQQALGAQGLTQSDIENKMKEQALIFNLIEIKIKNKIVIKPQEVNDFYEGHVNDFVEPEKREAVALVIKDETTACKIQEELKNNPLDFDRIAAESGLSVNNLGLVSKGQYKEEIEKAVFNLSAGEVSPPLELDGLYYIFSVKQIIPSRRLNLEETKETIYRLIFEKKLEQGLDSWVEELRKKSYIKIYEN